MDRVGRFQSRIAIRLSDIIDAGGYFVRVTRVNGGVFGAYATVGKPRRGSSVVLWVLGEASGWEYAEPTVLALDVTSGAFRHVALKTLRFVHSRVPRKERERARSLVTPANQDLAGIKRMLE